MTEDELNEMDLDELEKYYEKGEKLLGYTVVYPNTIALRRAIKKIKETKRLFELFLIIFYSNEMVIE